MSGSPLGDGEIDDSTVRSPRDRAAPDDAASDGAAPDEATVASDRRIAADPDAATFEVSSAEPDGTPGPRRTRSDEPAADTDEGSTMVVRRESRRRAEQGIHDAPDAVAPLGATAESAPPAGRIAHSPEPEVPVYVPRDPQPARIERIPRARREPQVPVDTLAAEAVARGRRRRRALLVAVAASVVLVLAVTALVVLTTIG